MFDIVSFSVSHLDFLLVEDDLIEIALLSNAGGRGSGVAYVVQWSTATAVI